MVRAPYSTESTDLREVMAQKVPAMQEKVKAFRKSYGSTKVGEITVDMVSGDTSGLYCAAFSYPLLICIRRCIYLLFLGYVSELYILTTCRSE